MSLGASYEYYHLKPIFQSLRKTGYQGDFVFFYHDLTRQTIQKLSRFSFQLIPFTYQYPYIKDAKMIEYLTSEPSFTPHPKTLRYLLYNAYLKANLDRYESIFIADCRDLVFQRSPFDDFKPVSLHCFQEVTNEHIGSNYFNSMWIREAFGEDTLTKLSYKPILCSGTTFGSISHMINYTETMIKTIKIVKDKGCKDQGIHNYILHTNQIKDAVLHADDAGPVSTISTFKPLIKIRLNAGKEVLGVDAKPVNIVHQYDRYFPLLWKHDKRGFFVKKWNLIKQFLLAIKKSRKIKKQHLSNLQSIIFDKMIRHYQWD
jgi:hypothetical protein